VHGNGAAGCSTEVLSGAEGGREDSSGPCFFVSVKAPV